MCDTQYNEYGLFRLMVAMAERARRDVEVTHEVYSGNQVEAITAEMKADAQEWLEDTGLAILDAFAPGYSPSGWQTKAKPAPRPRHGGRSVGTTDIQPAEILAAVVCLGGADASKIARYTRRNRGSLRPHLYRLVEQGQLRKGERGRYYPAQMAEGVTGD